MAATPTSIITTVVSALKTKPARLLRLVSTILPHSLYPNLETLTQIIGNFVVQKSRHSAHQAHIHSKPVVYSNNGGGRDTYISQNDGGFRPMHKAGHGKGTFYNNLRQYEPIG